jgi:NADH dehydrogenase
MKGAWRAVLIDRKCCFEFKPMLPDILAGWLGTSRVRVNLRKLANRSGFQFLKKSVCGLDAENRVLDLGKKKLHYDGLILACGSRPNFFKKGNVEHNAFPLNDASDAVRIRRSLSDAGKKYDSGFRVVVCGGGYTGLETATAVHYLMTRSEQGAGITIVEKTGTLLPNLPAFLQKECRRELTRIGIRIRCGTSVKAIENERVELDSGETIEPALCIWSAGVRTPDFIGNTAFEKTRSRVRVDGFLRAENQNGVFAAGDVAAVFREKNDTPLRMSVAFALGQGKTAAANLAAGIEGKPMKPYRQRDIGYLVPLTYGRAPGIVLGRRVSAHRGYFLHYLMCLVRSRWRQKIGIAEDLWNVRRSESIRSLSSGEPGPSEQQDDNREKYPENESGHRKGGEHANQ